MLQLSVVHPHQMQPAGLGLSLLSTDETGERGEMQCTPRDKTVDQYPGERQKCRIGNGCIREAGTTGYSVVRPSHVLGPLDAQHISKRFTYGPFSQR